MSRLVKLSALAALLAGATVACGQPSVLVNEDLTFDAGTCFAQFTVTNECALPSDTLASFSAGGFTSTETALTGSCPQPPGPITITTGTLNRPGAK